MLKKTICMLVFCGMALAGTAQSAEELLTQAQTLTKQMKETEALAVYKQLLQVSPGHVGAFTQSSLICSREAARQKDKSARQSWLDQARIYAYEALKAEPENAEANYAQAVYYARLAQISGAKEKVAAAKEVKKYADLALKFKPGYAEAYHLIGRWNFDLYNLSSLEKAAAKVLFGGVPPGTMEEAIANYEKCMKLKPSFLLNYLDLAIAFKQNNQETQSMEVLNKAVRLRPILQDDVAYKAECKKMLEEMQ
jgi:tetratricopeptide (TPR) repeat protein